MKPEDSLPHSQQPTTSPYILHTHKYIMRLECYCQRQLLWNNF